MKTKTLIFFALAVFLAAPSVAGAYGQGSYYSEAEYYSQSYYQTYYEGAYTAANLTTKFNAIPGACAWWNQPWGSCNNNWNYPTYHPYIPAGTYGNIQGTRFSLVFSATSGANSYGVSSDCRTWGYNGAMSDAYKFATFQPFQCVAGASGGSSFSVDAGTAVNLSFLNLGAQNIGYPNGCSFACGDAMDWITVTFLPTCTTNFGASVTYNNSAYVWRGSGSATVYPSAGTNNYTVTCQGGSPGVHSRTITINGNAVPAITSFTATPSSHASRVNTGSSLAWATQLVSSCNISGGSTFAAYPPGTSVAVNSSAPTANPLTTYQTTYTLRCTGNGGQALSSNVTVTVDQCSNITGVQSGAPSNGYLHADGSCQCNSGYTLSGSTCNANPDICTDIVGGQPTVPIGCQTPTPNPGACIPTGYTWTGTECVVSPPPPPTGCISVDNSSCAPDNPVTSVRKGDNTNVFWSVSGTGVSCSVNGTGASGQTYSWNTTSGNQAINNVQSKIVFTISCSNAGGSFNDTATINVIPSVQEI